MSSGLMYVRLLELLNPASHSISSRRKMRHCVTLARRLHLKMIVMSVILGALTLLVLMTLTSCGKLSHLPPSFYYAVHSERSYPMKRYPRSGKRTDALDLDLWDYMNGSSSVEEGTRQPRNYTDGSRSMRQSQTKQQETFLQSYQYRNLLLSGRLHQQEPLEYWEEHLLELNPSLQWPTKEGISRTDGGTTSM